MQKLSLLIILGLMFSCSPKMSTSGKAGSAPGKKSYKINTIAFYNLENLFDTIDDPYKNDEASPIMELPEKSRAEVYWKKNANMARVISEIGTKTAKAPPAIVGVAEIENRVVLEDLVNDPQLAKWNYGIIHYDSPDARGIDVALLYQKKVFRPLSSSVHEVVIYDLDNPDKRYYTRDVLLVSGILETDTIHFLVNHWPSRYGGEKRSRPNREKAAGVNKEVIDSLQAIDRNAKVIVMGDLNDGPYNTSVKKILGAKAEKKETPPRGIYNPFENMLLKKGLGTLGYRDSWDLFDQMMVTQSLLENKGYRLYDAGIYNPDYLINQSGRYRGYPFRSYSDGEFTGGYSDHFPVYLYLVRETQN